MSMNTLTMIQIAEISAAYTLITLLLPWIALRKVFRKFTVPEQIMGYFLAGNIYVIYLVFLVQFLHISGRISLIIGSMIPFAFILYKKCKGHIPELIEEVLVKIQYILHGEIGIKTFLFGKKEKKKETFTKADMKRWMNYVPDLVLTVLIIAGVCYVYGKNAVTVYGYKASDMPVHTYWVNLMDENHIFGAGVYPHGFHCIIYYLHVVFGFRTYVVMRVFGFVQTVFIHLAILVPLRGLCKTRYAPYAGTAVYLFGNFLKRDTYSRYASTLPQEYGMLFIFSTLYFAVAFLQEYSEVLKEENVEIKNNKEKKVKWYLLGLIISFSLTLTVHFYNTMIAGLLCVGIAAGYFFRCFQWKYLKKLITAAILSVALAVIPMAIGVAMGNPLQGSLYWGMNIIKGTANENGDTNLSNKKTVVKDKNGNEVTVVGDVDQETIDEIKNRTIIPETQSTQSQKQEEKKSLTDVIKTKLVIMLSQTKTYLTDDNMKAAKLVVAGIALSLVLGLISVCMRRTDYGGLLWSVGVYMVMLFALESMRALGLPELMDPTRTAIFFAYSIGTLAAVTIDAVFYLTLGWFKRTWIMDIAVLLVIIAGGYEAKVNHLYKEPIHTSALEKNAAVKCLTNIINNNEKNTWTICSANDETEMVQGSGYHYEMITFLKEMRNIKKNPVVQLPTNTVYFFIEKVPINYANQIDPTIWESKSVSKEDASKPLCLETGLAPYMKTERQVTMSHMYYWAQEFMKVYPNTMDVYYETDTFVCYRVSQNGYNLYNFAVDYGYNDPVQRITTETEHK